MSRTEMQIYFADALKQAQEIYDKLASNCERIDIAGSIRRKKTLISDIEIVCIPRLTSNPENLFTDTLVRAPEFISTVKSLGEVIKGSVENGKYIQILLPNEIKLDLFMADEDNYGLILMIRTGSWLFSKRMVTECKDKGYFVRDGYLWRKRDGEKIPVSQEKDFFSITGLQYIEPSLRIY